MRSAVEEEEEEELAPHKHERDRELTLSSSTLLGIFFGLVLICGLFFGLGYTLGRRAPASDSETGSQLPSSALTGTLPSPDAHPKPSASQSQAKTTPTQEDVQPVDPATVTPAEPEPDETSTPAKPSAKSPESAAPDQPKPAATQPAALPAAPAPMALMVQIAAVSNPVDADVLVGALRKRGYSVTVRHEAGDSYLHVQVGPFSSRADANAMRQKLQADGYNAILK